jgi:hypothetical protein
MSGRSAANRGGSWLLWLLPLYLGCLPPVGIDRFDGFTLFFILRAWTDVRGKTNAYGERRK